MKYFFHLTFYSLFHDASSGLIMCPAKGWGDGTWPWGRVTGGWGRRRESEKRVA